MDSAKAFLTRKIGPLPVYAYLGGVAVLLGAFLYFRGKPPVAAMSPTAPASPNTINNPNLQPIFAPPSFPGPATRTGPTNRIGIIDRIKQSLPGGHLVPGSPSSNPSGNKGWGGIQ